MDVKCVKVFYDHFMQIYITTKLNSQQQQQKNFEWVRFHSVKQSAFENSF